MPGQASRSLTDFLLYAAVADKGIGLVSAGSLAEACHKEALGNGAADSHSMSLA